MLLSYSDDNHSVVVPRATKKYNDRGPYKTVEIGSSSCGQIVTVFGHRCLKVRIMCTFYLSGARLSLQSAYTDSVDDTHTTTVLGECHPYTTYSEIFFLYIKMCIFHFRLLFFFRVLRNINPRLCIHE